MKAIELVRWALKTTEEGTNALVADMHGDAALKQPTHAGGNHTLWLLGHMTWVEGIVLQILAGEPNPVEGWQPLFGTGTEPKADAKLYPSFDEVLAKYRSIRAQTMKLLDNIGDAGLDRPPATPPPPGFEDAMETVGRGLLLLALHNMVHYGQIADARRAAGRKPLM